MPLLATFEGTRRSRRRRAFWRVFLRVALAALLAAGAGAGYRLGASQGNARIERLEQDLAELRQADAAQIERAARAEQQAEAAIVAQAELRERLSTELPQGVAKELLERVAAKLQAGVPPARLAFLIDQAAATACGRDLEQQRIEVHTPRAKVPAGAAAFAQGRILVSAEGADAGVAEGGTQPTGPGTPGAGTLASAVPGFDAARPVTVQFLAIDGDVGTAHGVLPLTHVLAQAKEEFRFSVRASDRPGQIEITSQRCPLP